jgi:hypothetical protein
MLIRVHPWPVVSSHLIPAGPALAVLDDLCPLLEVIESDIYSPFEVPARARLAGRDEQDWPVLAVALCLECPVWTENTDFFGIRIPTWTTRHVEIVRYFRGIDAALPDLSREAAPSFLRRLVDPVYASARFVGFESEANFSGSPTRPTGSARSFSSSAFPGINNPGAAQALARVARTASLDFLAARLHTPDQERLRVFAAATQLERPEVLVPVAFRSTRLRFHPSLQAPQVGKRNPALVYAFKKVLPQAARKIRESDLRQLRLSRKRRESVPVRLLPFSKALAPSETFGRRS